LSLDDGVVVVSDVVDVVVVDVVVVDVVVVDDAGVERVLGEHMRWVELVGWLGFGCDAVGVAGVVVVGTWG